MDAPALIAILKDSAAPEFWKAKACQRLGELGAKEAVPVLAALLADEHMSVYARYGLEPIADPSVDEALRSALSKLKGSQLIGVVNSIAKRRDAKAGPALVKMLYGSDADLGRAAASALGNIGADSSGKELKAALSKTQGAVRVAVADACLICAERLLAEGKRDPALQLYAALSAPDVPKPMRLAAMSGIIREETSTARPR
jgi:HEAT repeat protein